MQYNKEMSSTKAGSSEPEGQMLIVLATYSTSRIILL